MTLAAACGRAPDGRLLVTSGFTDQVFVLDAATGAVVDSVPMDRRPGERDEPHGVAVTPDGRHWYATLSHGEPTLWKFESVGNRLVGRLTLPMRSASRVRLSPDGAVAVVPEYARGVAAGDPGRVAFVRTYDLTVTGVAEVCTVPHDAAFSPDGRHVAVTCAFGADEGVVILDAETREPLARHPPGGLGVLGRRPMNVEWMDDGRRALVTLMGAGSVIDVRPDGTGSRFAEVGEEPAQLAISPDGAVVVVANRGDATVSVLSTTGEALHRVPMPGAHPHGVTFGTDAARAYVTYEGDTGSRGGIVAFDVRTGEIVWHTEVGVATLGVAYLAPPS